MIIGMLWQDHSDLPFAEKLQKAVDYYVNKYRRQPDLCFVHPGMLEAAPVPVTVDGVTVRPVRIVLPGHLWLGVEEKV